MFSFCWECGFLVLLAFYVCFNNTQSAAWSYAPGCLFWNHATSPNISTNTPTHKQPWMANVISLPFYTYIYIYLYIYIYIYMTKYSTNKRKLVPIYTTYQYSLHLLPIKIALWYWTQLFLPTTIPAPYSSL